MTTTTPDVREALKPFAKFDGLDLSTIDDSAAIEILVTVGDLRRAREAYDGVAREQVTPRQLAIEREAGGYAGLVEEMGLTANLMEKWANALAIPSGPFVNDDCRAAARGLREAAAAITALSASTDSEDRLREAVEVFTKHYEPWMDDPYYTDGMECTVHSRHTFGDLRRARAALTPKETG